MKKRMDEWVRRGRIAAASALIACGPAGAAIVADPQSAGVAADESVASRPVVLEVFADRLNVRARPGIRYEITCQVLRGDRVTAVGEEEGWLEILAPSGSAVWVHGAFVRDGRIIGDRVNLRAGPSLSYSIVGRAIRGTPVEAMSEYNEWIEIVPPAGVTFWVSGEFLRPVDSAVTAPPSTTWIRTFTPPDEPGVEKIEMPTPGDAGVADPSAAPPEIRAEHGAETAASSADADPGGEVSGLAPAPVPGEPPDAAAVAGASGDVETASDESAVIGDARRSGAGYFSIPPAQPDSLPLVLSDSEIEWLGPPRDVALIGEIHRTGFLVRRPGSHKLIQRNGRRARLICYLRSDEVELDRFMGKDVRLIGAEQWAKGWPRPVVHVRQASIVR